MARAVVALFSLVVALPSAGVVACGGDGGGMPGGEGGSGAANGGGGPGGGGGQGGDGLAGSGGGGADVCPPGVTCVDSFPFTDQRDTSAEGESLFDGYACSPATDESGPEILYRVTVPEAGFLSAAVYDGDAVDIDVHILSAEDVASCLDRGDLHASADVVAGDYWIVADTFVSGGLELAGAFRIDIGFIAPSSGPCDLEVGVMERVGDGGNSLAMPALGPIVMEAHLVTDQEPPPYPTTATEELDAHYELSQSVSELVMHRQQVWAPLEGGSFYGAGIGSPTDFPTAHEAYYVNMYWTSTSRPAKGTRMILRDPNGGARAVVVAAGYETGPGNLAHIGGTPEETHFYMGTGHLSDMQIGIAVDQTLPFGPRTCQ
jgi:hypothetical protein